LGHSLSAEETLLALGRQLDQTYQRVATNLSSNPLARVEKVDDKDELVLTSPDKLEEPPSLVRLRNEIAAPLPRVGFTRDSARNRSSDGLHGKVHPYQ